MDHEFHNGTWGKKLADLTTKSAAEEALKCNALDILAGIG